MVYCNVSTDAGPARRWVAQVGAGCLGLWAALTAWGSTASPPVTPVRPVVDDYYGLQVTDRYRWMESTHGTQFRSWLKKENAYTHAVLATIQDRHGLLQRIRAWAGNETQITTLQVGGGRLVYEKRGPGEDTSRLYQRQGIDGPETLLLDPNIGAAASARRSIDYLQLSPDGAYVAVGISVEGSEDTQMRILETASGKALPERIDRTQYAAPAWLPDSHSFFYNRLAKTSPGATGESRYLNSRALWHKLGDSPEHDAVLLAAGTTPEVPVAPADAPVLSTSSDSDYVLAVNYHGAALDETVYVKPLKEAIGTGRASPWRKVADVDDEVAAVALHHNEIFLLSHKDAPRYQVLKVDAAEPDIRTARKIIPESDAVIQDMSVARDGLYLRVLEGGIQHVRRLDYLTGRLSVLTLPPTAGGISELAAQPQADGALFPVLSWIQPQRWYAFEPSMTAPRETRWMPPSRIDTSGYEIEETQARALDGTEIPLSLIHKRGLLRDGRRPTLLTAYGAYGVSLTPHFVPGWFALLERDGLVAVAHIRGGGEFGEGWHAAGQLANKPNSYRDLIACAEYLIQEHYTRPASLAVAGTEAGGLAVAMAATTRPDLFRVVLIEAGDSNVLRSGLETHGGAKALEFGSVATRSGFKSLYAVDVLQHVKDATAYPATLLTAAANDPRVSMWQPAKLAAALQAANVGARPVLLRIDTDAQAGSSGRDDELLADQLAFMLWQMEDP